MTIHDDERGQTLLQGIAAAMLGLVILGGAVTFSMSLKQHASRERTTGYTPATSTAAELRASISYDPAVASAMMSSGAQTLSDGTIITPQSNVLTVRNGGATAAIAVATSAPTSSPTGP
jgi:hypothetical protein